MKFAATDCISILGARGSGKSILARNIQKAWPRQIILDPMHEYNDGEIVSSFDKFVEKIRHYEKNNTKKFRLIYQFDPEDDDLEPIFNGILRVCFNFKNVQIVIEEIQLFTHPHHIPTALRNCIFIGRHHGISLVFVTQRPGALNKNILSQCVHIFAGRIHEKNDTDYLRSIFRDKVDELPNIAQGFFLHFTPGKQIITVSNGFKK